MCITKTYIRLIISIILVVFTCQCEEDNYPARERVPVYAGMYDTVFVYQEFEPALQVALKLDTSNNCYYGYDYKYGWIKVNAASRYQLAYMSCAFER